MTATLKAVKPGIVKPGKPKIMISGGSGAGKTYFALDFPKPYLIDTESGATRQQYIEKLLKDGGAYFGKEQGSQNFKSVVDEFKTLATIKHDYKTVILDSFTYVYLLEAASAEETVGNDFGKDKKEANKPSRQLLRWMDAMDMSVILIAHKKDKYEKTENKKEREYAGTTFDGYDKLEFILDLWVEIELIGKNRRFRVKKSRITEFPVGESFPLDYKKFASMYGEEIINGDVRPFILATQDQVYEMNALLEVVKISADEIGKWFKQAGVSAWEEMSSDTIEKCITFVKKKIPVSK